MLNIVFQLLCIYLLELFSYHFFLFSEYFFLSILSGILLIYLPILWVGLDILNLFYWLMHSLNCYVFVVMLLHISLHINGYNYYMIPR